MGCHSDRKSQSFLIFNLEAPFWASILQLVVGSVSGRISLILPEGKGELCGKSLNRRRTCSTRKTIPRDERETSRASGK